MKLDERTMRLIAVGASINAHCQSCLETNVRKALENGADEQEVAEAIGIGKLVRKSAAAGMDRFAETINKACASPLKIPGGNCCGSGR